MEHHLLQQEGEKEETSTYLWLESFNQVEGKSFH